MPVDNTTKPAVGELKEEFAAFWSEAKRGLSLVFKGARLLLRDAIGELEKEVEDDAHR